VLPVETTTPFSCSTRRSLDIHLTGAGCTYSDSDFEDILLTGRVCRPVLSNCDKAEECQTIGSTSTCPPDLPDGEIHCDDKIACSDDFCEATSETEPRRWTCRNVKSNDNCIPCSCAPGQCVGDGRLGLWDDDCLHLFGETVIPQGDYDCCKEGSCPALPPTP
jgi:hypothetical protein